MEEKIQNYVNGVFRDVPKSERAETIRSEILQNLLDKYRDLKKEGRSDEDAYAIAISSGGDLSGIVADLNGENVKYSYTYEKQFEKMYDKQYKREKKKCAAFSSCLWPITVCLYFLISFLIPGMWGTSWIIFIVAAAVNSLFAYFTFQSNQKKKSEALKSTIWVGIVALYLILSFATGRWDITWILFLLGVAVSNLVRAVTGKDEDGWDDDDDDDDKEDRK